MCDIHRSVDGFQIIFNCTKPIRKTKQSMESDEEEEYKGGRKKKQFTLKIFLQRFEGAVDQGHEVTVNRLLTLLPFPSTVPPLSSAIPTTRPLSLTAYGGLQSSAAILTGKHSAGHNAADKTRHLLVLLKQDHTICSSAPIPQPPHHRLLKSSFQLRRFQVGYSSPPRVQSPHLCPAPAPFTQLAWRDYAVIPPSSGTRGVHP